MPDDCTILSVRIIDYPRQLVFIAWEDPAILQTWWGPKDFTNTFYEFDFVPGGSWFFCMHAPDGTAYLNTNVFEKIVFPELIVFNHIEPVHQFKVTVSFDEAGAQTKLIFHMLFESAEECVRVKPFVRVANEQNFDRLEAALSKLKITN
jgi:uncharacterized protein YndB with AHSA1/START domain